MREVEVDRFVAERPEVIARALSPERIVEWEGSFDVVDVEPFGDDSGSVEDAGVRSGDGAEAEGGGEPGGTREATLVTVSGPGVGFRLRFERLPDGYHYTVPDETDSAGPFDHMETRLVVAAENKGSRVRIQSTVSLNAPLPFSDRIAAWKRRGELERALDGLVDAV